jgi:proteasome lid subunit RPN8/RPN11
MRGVTLEKIDVEQETHWTVERGSWNRIVQHALDIYPKEACGILLNHSEKARHIKEVYPTKNISSEDQAKRYLVDPNEFIDADKWADEQGLDICGFYHSHPDHPSAPSEYDRKMAWEGYLYLILSIKGGKYQDARAWIYDSDEEDFRELIFKPPPLEPLPLDPSHP